jgi:tartrate-resistant acid phosphatase type 5
MIKKSSSLLCAAVMVAAMLVCGQSPALPEAAQEAPVVFAVIGDFGLAGQHELDVANLVKSWAPDFIVTVGDNNYPSGDNTTIDANIGQYYADYIYPYSGRYQRTSTHDYNQLFPSLGNHDLLPAGCAPYLAYFTLPDTSSGNERYYEKIWGPVHLFALNSNQAEPDGYDNASHQAQWLKTRLAASTAPWKVVFFHHAPYSSASAHYSTEYMQWSFQAWGASAVLAGHDHTYERIVLNGFPYFVNGAGGAPLYGFGTPIAGSQVRYSDEHGAMRVTATQETLTLQFFSTDGTKIQLIDSYALSKTSTTSSTSTTTTAWTALIIGGCPNPPALQWPWRSCISRPSHALWPFALLVLRPTEGAAYE